MSDPLVILGNSNPRFSGVTSTMLQTLPKVRERVSVAVLGKHHLPEDVPVITFRELLRLREKPHVFHARRNDEMIQALIARRLGANLKIVFTSTAQRYHSRFTRWLMSKMNGIISTCSGAASYLEHEPDVIIPHGINLDAFQAPSNKSAAWNKLGFPGKYGIGIFGRVRPQKGIDVLIEAAIPLLKDNPDPTIVIVGQTTPKFLSFENKLKEKVSAAGLSDRIIFHGNRPGKELPGLFQGMSLVTSLSRNEGFGLTVIEAMACECAVLASRAGAWPDIVIDGTHGYTVPCSDVPATREALEKLLAEPEKLIEMGCAGRLHVEEHFTTEREANQLCDFYLKIAES